ncbi:flavin-containing monooxygenase [Sandaracinus amylolyticus]|uniref:flavin-containing monooxygenase n=1 Tax=Sandaracinus amylolyticus TaxID=927083 RepID=UPI00069E92DD|nr:NAD(P)/FAD-dependent oxidoreductase [Sandaracinus amylolyticus]
MIKTVAIIGAGFAGLSTAKVLKTFGYEVTVFEKAADVGGVWSASRRYPGLTTQNPRTTYALSDFPMPASYPEWPSGAQVQAYLAAYAEHFGIAEHVLLETEVQRASYDERSATWTVRARRRREALSLAFDFLVVCNGIFSAPFVPSYAGRDEFVANGGRICHTCELHDPEDARGKHVLVVGYGKSSCDVASAVASTSASTTVVARELIWKVPKLLGKLLNFKFLLLTRMGEALFEYIELAGLERFLHGAGRGIRDAMLGSVEAVITRQLRLRELGLHPGKPLETIARSTVSLASDGFFEQVASGALTVERNVEIVRLSAGYAHLSDGREVRADLVVCGTGFQQRVPFLDDDVVRRVTDAQGNFQLHRSVLPVGVPRLAFNGYNSSFFSQLNCEMSALWLVQHLRGDIALPSEAAQREHIARRLAWMEARTAGKHAKGTNIIPFSLHHIDELLADMKMTLSPAKRVAQWLLPVDPSDYAYVERALRARYGAESARDAAASHERATREEHAEAAE